VVEAAGETSWFQMLAHGIAAYFIAKGLWVAHLLAAHDRAPDWSAVRAWRQLVGDRRDHQPVDKGRLPSIVVIDHPDKISTSESERSVAVRQLPSGPIACRTPPVSTDSPCPILQDDDFVRNHALLLSGAMQSARNPDRAQAGTTTLKRGQVRFGAGSFPARW
jgi:hypothetical protein